MKRRSRRRNTGEYDLGASQFTASAMPVGSLSDLFENPMNPASPIDTPRFCFASLFLAAVASLPGLPGQIAHGDGPADNVADNVRPIPPIGLEIPDGTIDLLKIRCGAVRSQWNTLVEQQRQQNTTGKKASNPRLRELESFTPEVLVFPRAVELAIDFRQFYKPNDTERASKLLDEAVRRIKIAERGGTWHDLVGLSDGRSLQLIVGGFRSDIDGSYQPYGLVVPTGYAALDSRPRRLDLWFHGRGESLSEVGFLSNQLASPGRFTPSDTFVLHPYGRYSNAFKFAGEIDVLESLRYIQSRLPVDPDRISVRGFSMGGAACWQFATHHADRWFAANPGAGFSETPEFLKFFQAENVRETAPAYQQTLWQLYDCPPWAGNLAHCPTVAYSGEVDRQKQAADVMESTLKGLGIDMVHIIGPDTAHNIHPESKIEIESRMGDLARFGSRRTPSHIDFTTVTLRYHTMHWIDVQGLQSHWTPARVTATIEADSTVRVTTQNVTALRLHFRPGQWPGAASGPIHIRIDGDEIEGPDVASDRSWSVDLARDGSWKIGTANEGLQKRPGLQGPIDDAFMDSFLFVLPTGRSDDRAAQAWFETESEHAMMEWRRHFRGDIRAVFDVDLTAAQIANNHLVLFGDERSNEVTQKIVAELPLTWTKDSIVIGDAKVDRAGHVPVLIHPNPLNPNRYVVLNSGFTFREYDYLNNARQTPKLPDWALIDVTEGATSQDPGKVKAAGFFDEQWRP